MKKRRGERKASKCNFFLASVRSPAPLPTTAPVPSWQMHVAVQIPGSFMENCATQKALGEGQEDGSSPVQLRALATVCLLLLPLMHLRFNTPAIPHIAAAAARAAWKYFEGVSVLLRRRKWPLICFSKRDN